MIGNMLSDLLRQASELGIGVEDPVLAASVRFLGRMQSHAFGAWTAVARAGVRCRECGAPAVGACVGCGTVCCPDHAMVSVIDGACLCHSCVAVAIAAARSAQAKTAAAPGGGPPYGWGGAVPGAVPGAGASGTWTGPAGRRWPPPPPAGRAREPTVDEQREFHMKVLGIDYPLSAEKVASAYKKAAAKNHPDKFRTEAQKKRAQERFVRVGAARDWLLHHMED